MNFQDPFGLESVVSNYLSMLGGLFSSSNDGNTKVVAATIQATSGDKNAAQVLVAAVKGAVVELTSDLAKGAGIIGDVANQITVGAVATQNYPVAIAAGAVSKIADVTSVALNTIVAVANQEVTTDTVKSYVNIGIDIVVSRTMPAVGFNQGANRFIDDVSKQFIKTIDGITATVVGALTQTVAGKTIDALSTAETNSDNCPKQGK